jgi:hypothetical protein
LTYTVDIPSSASFEHYEFSLYAYENGTYLGRYTTVYYGANGWDYRFKISKEKPRFMPWLMLLLDDAKEKCSELTETWHLELSDGSGSGEVVLKKDSNCEVTSSGAITSNVYGVIIEYQSKSIKNLSGGEYVSISTGTASLISSPSVTSDIEMTTSGVVSKGVGIGQSVTKYTAPGWPETTTGNFVMTRIDGSGITPETGDVDLNEGSDEQFVLCVSNCSGWGFLITNATKEPVSRITTIHSIYDSDNRLTAFDGDIKMESTDIIYEFLGTHYWSPLCSMEVEVIGVGTCQTNPF